MNKRITSLLLCFVMVFTMLATAVPAVAAPVDACTFTVKADKTSANPGETITFTIYMEQVGVILGLEGTLKIPSGLTYVAGSGKTADGIKTTLGWDAFDWTEESLFLNRYGSENYTDTSEIALMTFQCTVDSDAVAKAYSVTFDEALAANEVGEPKEVTVVPATVNVTAAPKPATYTVTVQNDGNGTASASPATAAAGTEITLSATANSGYHFKEWQVVSGTVTIAGNKFAMPSSDVTVKAIFEENAYTGGGGGGGSYYAPVVPDMPMVYWGCTGDAVKTLQEKLNAKGFNSGNVDGIFGAKTYAAVTAFQKANSLGVDGIVGKLTWAKLYDATPVNVTPVTTQPMLRTGSRGDAVRKLQELLNAKGYTCGSVDGIFGSKTYAAVLAFQKANGLGADGIVDPLTWAKLG